MVRGRKYTKQEVLKGIKKAWEEGVDLRASAVQKSKYRWVYRSYGYYYTSWKEALLEAGLKYSDIINKVKEPKKRKYLEELKKAFEEGMDLSSSSLQSAGYPARGLYERAKTFYKSKFFWEMALMEAGLPIDKIVKQKRWDKHRIKIHLKKRDKDGLAVNSAAVKDGNHALYKAIRYHFDSYDEALTYAGFDPLEVRGR